MKDLDFLKKVCEAHVPSGKENIIFPIIKDNFSEYADNIKISKLNNIYVHKKGTGTNTVMIMAHADEVFLMVDKILNGGFIEFKTLGIDTKSLVSQKVLIHGRHDICGIVALKSKIVADKLIEENLYIDTGLNSDELKSLVRIGDYITLDRKMTELLNSNISCKSIDNRASIASMYVCAEELKNVTPDLNIYFVCSCQEEVGHRGAAMASYDIKPDIGIAVDVTFDGGSMGDLDRENALNGGPVICIGPNIHPKLRERIINTAKKYNIPYQIEVEPGNTGTDAWDIQTSQGGIPTLLISIPIKYMHTSVEIVNMNDIRNTGRLLARFIQELSSSELEGLFCF
ncbi:M20/M25/M40 family metallo-hydrolase [Clostridium tyrobutyricum]|uniref:M20/M25/M40 family metallo-hydrolase n=1 Tax=Clostridium tyrobutyricum TaxID=1519 RepID=UPI001C38070A|nr:M20/M25/M40 family metallo-hydrolase [Clostridium tyrobutyricum]MBV4420565.1 M20/M25/M40 family metallo-hydrolase [Clostridium tyrobutyricum]